MSKPYELSFPSLEKGDPVGWVGRSGTVHVEVVKDVHPGSRGSTVVEVESDPDVVQRAHDAMAAAHRIAVEILQEKP